MEMKISRSKFLLPSLCHTHDIKQDSCFTIHTAFLNSDSRVVTGRRRVFVDRKQIPKSKCCFETVCTRISEGCC